MIPPSKGWGIKTKNELAKKHGFWTKKGLGGKKKPFGKNEGENIGAFVFGPEKKKKRKKRKKTIIPIRI